MGLPCGGEIELLVQPVSEAGFAPTLFARIAEARAAGETIVLGTDFATGKTSLDAAPDEGVFVNRYAPPRRVLIVGAVQIAQSLAMIARTLDVAPLVIDPRGRFLTEERFPNAPLDDRWPDAAIAAWQPDAATAVVTLSHDPKIDDPALARRVAVPCRVYWGARFQAQPCQTAGGACRRWGSRQPNWRASMLRPASRSVRWGRPKSLYRSRRG